MIGANVSRTAGGASLARGRFQNVGGVQSARPIFLMISARGRKNARKVKGEVWGMCTSSAARLEGIS